MTSLLGTTTEYRAISKSDKCSAAPLIAAAVRGAVHL